MQLNSNKKVDIINKIAKINGYANGVNLVEEHNNFLDDYEFFVYNNIKENPKAVWASLERIPRLTSILAKNFLYQGNEKCWKYFDRDVVFRVKSSFNEQFLDTYKDIVEFSLYIENENALREYVDKVVKKINKMGDLKEFQEIYPSTRFAWYLAEKWSNYEPIKSISQSLDNNFGIYTNIVENWNDFDKLDNAYWLSLCDYHLNGLDLNDKQTYENEEFISSGLIPVELINLIKIRQKLNLCTPEFDHELFRTSMSKPPKVPTDYDINKDVKYLFIKDTIKLGRKLDYDSYLLEHNFSEESYIIY